jgi:uncharacterized HAD superfamily protein
MIILDIDGVVANPFNELNFVLERAGYETYNWNTWRSCSWQDAYPHVDQDFISQCALDYNIYRNAIPFEDAWYWANHYSSTYDLMYLTARPNIMSETTWSWFMDWDIPADFVVFEPNKVEFLVQIKPDVFVDDDAKTVQLASNSGVNAFLMNRPYNANDEIDDKLRINSLWEIELN